MVHEQMPKNLQLQSNPYTIWLPEHPGPKGSLLALDNLPFEIKRAYWVYGAEVEVQRGGHAHKNTHQIFFTLTGKTNWICEWQIKDNSDEPKGQDVFQADKWSLDHPNIGLYVPPMCWHTFDLFPNTVLLGLASSDYDEEDYIRAYGYWKEHVRDND